MKTRDIFMGSRIGRRIVGLFLLAACVPVLVLAGLGWNAWRDHRDHTAKEQLTRDVKSSAMRVLDRLILARTTLEALMVAGSPERAEHLQALGNPTVAFVPNRQAGAHDHRRPTAAGGDGSDHRTANGSTPAPATSARAAASTHPAVRSLVEWWRHATPLPDRRLHIRASGDTGGVAQIVLSIRDDAKQGRLIVQLDPAWLWNDLATGDDAACVFVGIDLRLHCEGAGVGHEVASPPGTAEGTEVAWELFLGHEFGAPNWRFQARRPASDAMNVGGLSLNAMAALVISALLLTVAALSMVLVRRTLSPLRALAEGTRRLSAGNESVRVEVAGADEFAELGQSFNEMADRLAAQTRTLAHRGTHDSLTGLLNRNGLQESLDGALAQANLAADARHAFALLLLDLDDFSCVNDTLGHGAGDHLLREAARRLRATVPAEAVVARQGGDEFVLLLPGETVERAEAHARAVCAAMAEPFVVDGHEFQLGGSAGIALAPRDGRDANELVRRADLAMYAAKAEKRHGYVVFEQAMEHRALERSSLLEDLRRGIGAGELRLHFQPRVGAVDGRMRSAEALVRWAHPTRGLLFPDRFIGLAEESGLIEPLGQWVLDEACRQLALWRTGSLRLDRVSVNVSVHQLGQPGFVATVDDALRRHRLAGSALELEVTESVMANDAQGMARQLHGLRALGVRLALDDFGTGYSSLVYLRRLPLDLLKIDKAFVRDLGRDAAADEVTRAIIALAQALNLALVAEGVETVEQSRLLRGWGVQELQGYLYAKPMAADVFEAWARQSDDSQTLASATAPTDPLAISLP